MQSILAGADNLKFGYVTRYSVKDSSRHVILGTQQFKPVEFGQQINLNMDNAWGVVRCILDIIMQQKVEIIFTKAMMLPNCLIPLGWQVSDRQGPHEGNSPPL